MLVTADCAYVLDSSSPSHTLSLCCQRITLGRGDDYYPGPASGYPNRETGHDYACNRRRNRRTRSHTIVARTRADAAPASLIPPGCSSLVSKYRSLTWSRILHSLGLARAHSAECAQFACSSRWPRSLRLTSHCLLSLFSRPAWPWPCQCTLAPHRFSGPPGRRRAVVARRRARW